MGPKKIGWSRQNDSVGRGNRIQNHCMVITDHALSILEQAPIASPARLNLKVREPQEAKFARRFQIAEDLFDHDFTIAQFPGRADNSQYLLHSLHPPISTSMRTMLITAGQILHSE
jgi:hypothetical protein